MIRWSEEKDRWLRVHRGVSFQEITLHLLEDDLMDIVESPFHKAQQAFVVRFRGYAWVVPFVVEKDGSIFLKTAYPSRKMNRRYGGRDEAKR